MIGDVILMVRRLWRQHITCRHNYKVQWGHDIVADYYVCSKCDKLQGFIIK